MAVTDDLAHLLRRAKPATPEAAAALICRNYALLPKHPSQESSRESQPEPEAGQIWHNRKSHRLIEIDAVITDGLGQRHIQWKVADGSQGPKTGQVFLNYWKSRFDFVAQSVQDAL